MQTMPNTVRFHRVLRATPEKIYRAFLDADAMAKWLSPNGFTGKVHHLDAKVGGTYKMSSLGQRMEFSTATSDTPRSMDRTGSARPGTTVCGRRSGSAYSQPRFRDYLAGPGCGWSPRLASVVYSALRTRA